MKQKPKNLAASVRARLTDLARKRGDEFQFVLTRYVIERFLYRLSISNHQKEFVLKGAMLFPLWGEVPHRATRDLDLLGTGDSSVKHVAAVIKTICSTPVKADGLAFDAEKLSAVRIREDEEYEGVRVTCEVRLGQARIALQIDIGFGDAINPRAARMQYPTLLDFPAPVLAVYPRATVVAEKFQAIVALGLGNSRMKDFFDIWIMARDFKFDGAELAHAISATFQRRKTPIPANAPLALTAAFGADVGKAKQWQAFVRRGKLHSGGVTLEEVAAVLHRFLMPPTVAVGGNKEFILTWLPGGPWGR